MVFFSKESPWYVVTFDNNDETQFAASIHFSDEIYSAYISNPFLPQHPHYFYKHTDIQSIYYLSPEAAVISPDLLKKYGAEILLEAPDTSGYEEHIL